MSPERVERERPRMPTPRQLALAADTATRFAEASVRDDEETYSALRRAAHTMGIAALAAGTPSEDT
jgi:hypothetical protein